MAWKLLLPSGSTPPSGADFLLGYSGSQIFEQLARILKHLDVLLLGKFFFISAQNQNEKRDCTIVWIV